MEYSTMAQSNNVVFRVNAGLLNDSPLYIADVNTRECIEIKIDSFNKKILLLGQIRNAVNNNDTMQQIKLLAANFIETNNK